VNVLILRNPNTSDHAVEKFRSAGIDLQPEFPSGIKIDAALIFGGDGTVHRHLPRLYAEKIPALVVPKGSGNDFAGSLGIRNEKAALDAWKQFCAGRKNVREIDLGVIRAQGQEILFCCVAGAGLDSEANARANRMARWLRSSGGYLLAVVRALISFRPLQIEVTTEQHKAMQRAFLVAVGNAHRYGHGIKIVPRAELDDGLLDICMVGPIGKWKIFLCLPIIYFGGHTRLKEVEYFRARTVCIESTRPLELYADGEFACRTPVEISLRPKSLAVIVPL
jgi:diacylglycerol kinase (ATP)